MATPDGQLVAEFWVPGVPQPGGSKKAFMNPRTKRIVVVDACKRNKDWRTSVQASAVDHYDGNPVTCPLSLTVNFVIPRPKGHYGTGKNADKIKASAPLYPAKKPDATKLLRSTEDALTGIIWRDDAQIVEQVVRKTWGEKSGAWIKVETMGEQ